MGKTALQQLREASEIRKLASGLTKSDPDAAEALRKEAHKKTMRAVRQMRTKPKNAAQKASKAVI